MSILSLISALCLGTALGHLAALVGILSRYAIPRAPKVFHVLLFVPMCLAAASIAVVGLDLLLDEQDYVGSVGILEVFAVYVASEFLVWWILVSYSLYYRFKTGRRGRCPF